MSLKIDKLKRLQLLFDYALLLKAAKSGMGEMSRCIGFKFIILLVI